MAGTGRISLSYSAVGNVKSTHQYNVTATFEIGFNYGGWNNNAQPWSMSCDGQPRSGSSSFSVPSGGGSWRYATITTQTFTVTMGSSGTSKTVSVSAYMETGVRPSSISASNSITLPAVNWVNTISYNANGGSGAPGSQSYNYGNDTHLSGTQPTRTGYTFLGWSLQSNASSPSYSAGQKWSGYNEGNYVLYAVWKINTYTVSYNANGGSSAPSNQIKTFGQNLTLSNTVPTRQNYDFLGWSTNQSASVAEYSVGSTYTANSGATLYAVWKLAYWFPKITDVFVHRCTDTGANDEEGLYAKVDFNWECCQLTGANNVKSITVEGNVVSASGMSGSTTAVVGGNYAVDEYYRIAIVVTDSKGGSSTYDTYVESIDFTMDFKAGGKGVAFGMPAKEDGFHVNFPSRFYENIQCEGSIDTPEGAISGHSIVGDDVYSYGDITAQGALQYNQNILWSGTWHGGWAQAAGEAIFSEPVSIQHSGIVLVFQEYDPSTQKVSGTNINSFFVSKKQIALLSGVGVNFTFAQWFGNQFVSKYLYINDTKITGNVDNATGSWTRNGVTFCNNRTVLTKVIGV